MRNKNLFKSAAIIITSLFLFTACGNKTEPVNAEPTETVSEVDMEESEDSSESMEPVPSPAVEPTEEPEGEASEEFTITEMDIQMVVNTEAYTYENPTNESTMIGAAQKDELVHVIGQVDGTNWFKIEQGNGETDDIIVSFIDGEFLSEYTEPAEETPSETETPSESTQPETPAEKPQQPAETQQPQQPAQTEQPPAQPQQPAEQPSGGNGDGDLPQVGDVVGENLSGANDMIWGGMVDTSDFH